jgi:translation initiation factor 2B subunit (eIF-2B alpha/beta/delta family)
MPTFPSHWAPCSGSIEEEETPWQTANRELHEETNVGEYCSERSTLLTPQDGGLYVDVPLPSSSSSSSSSSTDSTSSPPQRQRIIRVYPFVVQLPLTIPSQSPENNNNNNFELQLRGTEHDSFQFVTVEELETTLHPTVPAMVTAFHHATRGQFLSTKPIPPEIEQWRNDRISGANTLAQQALQILQSYYENQQSQQQTDDYYYYWVQQMRMMRPTMIVIANVLNRLLLEEPSPPSPSTVLQQMKDESTRLVQHVSTALWAMIQNKTKPSSSLSSSSSQKIVIGTFSRSSTVTAVLHKLLLLISQEQPQQPHNPWDIHIVCAKSTPGDEGVFMAQDLNTHNKTSTATCVEDDVFHELVRHKEIDLVLIGADCFVTGKDSKNNPNESNDNQIDPQQREQEQMIVNKIGTRTVAELCVASNIPIWCLVDSFKK